MIQRWRSWLLVLLMASGVVAGLRDILQLAAQVRHGPTRTPAYLERFAGLAASLPARGTLGYLFDANRLATPEGYAAENEDYLLAARALAPRFLKIGVGPELVVGNFASPATVPPYVPAPEYSLVLELGNGIVLWRKP